jgi:hypothetical protein
MPSMIEMNPPVASAIVAEVSSARCPCTCMSVRPDDTGGTTT